MKEQISSCYHKGIPISQECPKTILGRRSLNRCSSHKSLINRLPTKVLDFKNPMETLTKIFPNFNVSSNLIPRIFASVALYIFTAKTRENLIHMLSSVFSLAIHPLKKVTNVSIHQQENCLFPLISPLSKLSHISQILSS